MEIGFPILKTTLKFHQSPKKNSKACFAAPSKAQNKNLKGSIIPNTRAYIANINANKN